MKNPLTISMCFSLFFALQFTKGTFVPLTENHFAPKLQDRQLTPILSCPTSITYVVINKKGWEICNKSQYNVPSQQWPNVPDAAVCAKLCANTQGCTYSVWDHKGPCHLKGSPSDAMHHFLQDSRFDGIKLAYQPADQSSISDCPWGNTSYTTKDQTFQWCPLSDYEGASTSIIPNVNSGQLCADMCAKSACQKAVWDRLYNYCHFKDTSENTRLSFIASSQFDSFTKLIKPVERDTNYIPDIGTGINRCPWGQSTITANSKLYTICPMSDYSGPSYNIVRNVNSNTSCAQTCAADNNCKRAVWDRTNNVCHLKDISVNLAWVIAEQFDTVTLTSDIQVDTNNGAKKAGTTEVIGSCGVNAQHMFVGTNDKVFLVDKTQANILPLVDRSNAALAAVYALSNGTCRPMKTVTNQFCAAGGTIADGSWTSGGGNPQQNGQGQTNGLRGMRNLVPCDGKECQWNENVAQLQADRWYPAAETMADGSLGFFGGYNAQVLMPTDPKGMSNTAEYYPTKGAPVPVPVLQRAFPFSLYALTSHLSDGRIFFLAGNKSAIWNPKTQIEQALPDMPNGPRTYPSGGTSVLLPLSPANNYTETMLLCGGSGLTNWPTNTCPYQGFFDVTAKSQCDQITPLASEPFWSSASGMPSPRLMGNMIILPDSTLALVNGAQAGTQGFGCDGPGESMATRPANTVHLYDPLKKSWASLTNQKVNRGYHSSATLLPDGSILGGGSSPHWEVSTTMGPFPTEYRLEKIYPSYYDSPRPDNSQVPTTYPYGGQSFTINFASDTDAKNAFIRIIRTGWSTHGVQMGQRSFELDRRISGTQVTFIGMPNNPNIFPPGSALSFLVVNGVPGIGKVSTVGPGHL